MLSAVLLACGIAVGSRLRVSHLGRTVAVEPAVHYALHVAGFAFLTFLFVRSTNSWLVRTLLFAGSLLFGYGTEFYEHLRDGYPVELQDVLADTVGAITAMVAVTLQSIGKNTPAMRDDGVPL